MVNVGTGRFEVKSARRAAWHLTAIGSPADAFELSRWFRELSVELANDRYVLGRMSRG